ncbi:hypothetical protein [Streptomyces sp. NPDC057740]|uniref:hypothetical protein n=1 Tax=Streptomyces sp. NPDC057740 TaxID=3346234 RepID=UPI00369DB674
MATNLQELMTMGIIHAFLRWVLEVFGPHPRCRHRADRLATVPPLPAPPVPAPPARPSSPRSPYGLASPLDGEETALVRPYLVAFEERRRRRERRLVLVHAADFGIDLIDLDQYVTGAREVA